MWRASLYFNVGRVWNECRYFTWRTDSISRNSAGAVCVFFMEHGELVMVHLKQFDKEIKKELEAMCA